MTQAEKIIELQEMEYQHQFDDFEKQMITEAMKQIAWAQWIHIIGSSADKDQFEVWYNK